MQGFDSSIDDKATTVTTSMDAAAAALVESASLAQTAAANENDMSMLTSLKTQVDAQVAAASTASGNADVAFSEASSLKDNDMSSESSTFNGLVSTISSAYQAADAAYTQCQNYPSFTAELARC